MTLINHAGTQVQLNAEGFLLDADQWSPTLAETIASEVGVQLSATHWEVVNFAREDFSNTGKSPGLRRIVANTDVTMKELYRLFPRGPGKLVARVAGIPKPKSCL